MAEIFVSYRRADSASVTGRIVEKLERRFGATAVFKDVFDIEGGQQFRDVISQQLQQAKVLLVIIGQDWTTAVDAEGLRRLDQENDYVRNEVETGLSRPDCLVIPVLVDRQPIPKHSELPQSMHALVDRNAMVVRPDPDFADDFEDLYRLIAKQVPPKKRWPIPLALGTLTVLAIILTAVIAGWNPPDTVIRVFDASTGDEIKRPFELTLDKSDPLPAAVEHPLEDMSPADLSINDVRLSGYDFDPDMSRRIEETETGYRVELPLTRSANFDTTIRVQSDDASIRWPSDAEIESQLDLESVSPSEVELIISNELRADAEAGIEAGQAVDVSLYWLPPSTWHSDNAFLEISRRNPDHAWTHIGPILHGTTRSFKGFGYENGFFMIFGSANGRKPKLLDRCSLYKAPFSLLRIKELNDLGSPIIPLAERPDPSTLSGDENQ